MKTFRVTAIMALGVAIFTLAAPLIVRAGDLDDGISEATDDAISGDDQLGQKNTNITFIITDAMAKANRMRHKNSGQGGGTDGQNMSNFNDGSGDNNQNSVVVGAGSKVDNVYNIVMEK